MVLTNEEGDFSYVLQGKVCKTPAGGIEWYPGGLLSSNLQGVPEKNSFQNFLADISGPTSWATLGHLGHIGLL